MAAAWMAQTGVKTLLIDEQPDHRTNGRADGLESRTLEILDSFGLADKVWAEANHTVEICLWVRQCGILLVISPNCGPTYIVRFSRWSYPKTQHIAKFEARVVSVL
jgi:2-polyprenyl-6-methoxyphenol hydroxylase-like FAD-dependent oxidoreductase